MCDRAVVDNTSSDEMLVTITVTCIAFLFLFLRNTDSRKGTICPFCVPIHKKKNYNLPF